MAKIAEELPRDTDLRRKEDPLLALRFAVPRPPRLYVTRRRLVNRLDEAADIPLTLVSAPAGSGKTTLLAEWVKLRRTPGTVAWITFEDGDDRPGTFWPLVLECLRRRGVTVPDGTAATSCLIPRQVLPAVCSALASLSHPITLILDDCDVTDARLAREIEFVLTHTGHRLRLVVLTRVEPVLPLHRFRLAGTVMELRLADLAFSKEETARLVALAGITLSSESVVSLLGRSRGWAVGLRFAVMVLAGSDDPDSAVDRLAGDVGNIAEYLMGEILTTQPSHIRELLLRTSVVDTLRPGLIEELGGRSAARDLAHLARSNMLVEEPAEHPGCYRYHPFLRDLLRAELTYASPGQLQRLQRRAATWYARQGLLVEAASLAVAAEAWVEAANYAMDDLIACRLMAGDDTGGLVKSLRQIPSDTGGLSASVVRAILALADKDAPACADALSRARELVNTTRATIPTGVRSLIDLMETVQACRLDDVQAVTLADQTLARLAAQSRHSPSLKTDVHGLIVASKGVAEMRRGNIEAARDTLSSASQILEASECKPLLSFTEAHLALVAVFQGRLRQAQHRAMRAIALADEAGMPSSIRPPEAVIVLGWVSTERYNLAAGREYLSSVPARDCDPIVRALAALVEARLLRASGDADGAIALVRSAITRLPEHACWLADLLGIEAAEAWIARGDADEALRVVERLNRADSATAALVRGHALARRDGWVDVGAPVAELSKGDSVTTSLLASVDGHLLKAAHELHRGRRSEGRTALIRALQLAAPEGLRRPIREAPPAVRRLLVNDAQLIDQNPWLGLPITQGPGRRRPVTSFKERGADPSTAGPIIEPLTAKEQEVLGHLSELLTTSEIASTMFISVNTVRTHVASILRKLGVSRRNEAVRRARALSLTGQ